MYQALYRKWRPKSFADVVGQSHITQTLQTQIVEGRTSHAYLFTGTRGTGKTTCAKILAKAVNCQHPVQGNPCNQCAACLGIDSGGYLDVLELDAASNNGVDQVRALRDEAAYSPANVQRRVYIVDEVHMLSTAAFNALLKILEEPPAHLLFILATTELHKVPATILSRCQRFTFKRILPGDVARRLLEVARGESIPLTADGADLLARLADGALRDGLSLLDQCASVDGTIDAQRVLDVLGLAGNLATAKLMESILNRNTTQALTQLHQLYQEGKDVSAVLGELSTLSRDLLLCKTAPGGDALLSGAFDGKTLAQLGAQLPTARLMYLTQTLQSAMGTLHQSPNRRTDSELCLLRLCDESLSWDVTAMEARIVRLEQGISAGAVVSVAPVLSETEIVQAPPEDAPPPQKAPPIETPPWDEIAPEPTPEPMHQAPPTAPETQPQGGTWWRDVVHRCKGQLPPMYRAFLDLCDGVIQGELLSVYAPDEVTLGRIDNERVRGVLLQETAGDGAVHMLIQVGSAPKQADCPQSNLQNLLKFSSQFDNITIES